MRLVQALDPHGRIRAAPNEAPGLLDRLGLTPAEAEASVWTITPGGRRYAGAAAVAVLLATLWRTWLPYRLYRLPGIGRLAEAAYAWVARHRHRFPGDTPYCQQHPDQCGG